MDTLRQDLVHAVRSLWKSPGYAAVTILTLALGIGANSAIFSVINGVLLRPLPYPDPARLLFITSQFPTLGFPQFWVSVPEFIEFRERNRSFEDVGGYRAGAVNLGTADQPRRVNSALVTSELMPVLGVQPLRGRLFSRPDTLPGAEDVAILSSDVWQSAFGGEESVVGRVIPIDGVSTRIVGIMPPGYDIHEAKAQVWLPLTIDPATPGNRGGHFLYLVGRLENGVSESQARSDIESMLAQWNVLNPKMHTPDQKNHRLQFDRLQDDIVGGIGTALWVLQGAVGFVLLIACANLANLLLARAESRQKEYAIRSALGAGRWRLLRQFMTEGVVLALAGGTLGTALGVVGLKAMIAANPESLPRAAEVTLDPGVLAFTLLISVLTGVLFGMAPLLQLREKVVNVSLKEAGQRSTAGAARARLRSGLVMLEVALAVVLVIGAGLLLRSLWNLTTVDAGFKRSQLVTFGLVLPPAQYREPQSRVDFFQRLTGQLSAISGVQSAAVMSGLPPQRLVNANDVDFEGYSSGPEGPFENVDYFQTVTQPYLATMGIPIVEGRDFARRRHHRRAGRTRQRDAGEDVLSESGRHRAAGDIRAPASVLHHRRRGSRREAGRNLEQDRDGAVLPRGPGAEAGARARRHECRGANIAAGRFAVVSDSRPRPVHGSDPAGHQAADDGRSVRGIGVETAIHGAAARALRRPGARPCRGRHVRDPGLHGEPAAQRDRHPHGARCDEDHRSAHGARPGTAVHTRRPGPRHSGVVRSDTAAADAAVQRRTERPGNHRAGCGLHRSGGDRRLSHSRQPRSPRGSDGRSQG